jgi:hypothetical protein
MIAQRAREQDRHARRDMFGRHMDALGHHADASGGDEKAVAMAALDDLVSPVAMGTPAARAAAPMLAAIRSRSASAKPSSMMKAADSATGRAPAIATSLTVPCTASEPMSPPGNSSGLTTWASVLITRRPGGKGPAGPHHAPDPAADWRNAAQKSRGSAGWWPAPATMGHLHTGAGAQQPAHAAASMAAMVSARR